MSKDLPINLDNTNDIYRRQASLGGNKITRSVDNTEGNTTLVWGRVTQVYYQKGTCDFTIQGQSNIFVDNSGSDGTLSAPIPVDYYGKNYDGHPFIKTRLIQKGNKVLVAFVNGSTANPVIIGVYPDNSESYELLSPALDNKISDNTEDTNYRVNNEIEINPANQMIYKSGDGSWAKSMQGRSFLIVQGNKNFELEKVSSCYENIPYFYKDNASDEPVNYPTPVYSENTKAPEWLLVHEGNWELDGSSDKHRTRFYVNQEGELQIVFFTLDKPEELLVVDGNKDNGFTIMKQFDSDTPMDKNSKNYVKFNVGDNNEISMSVSSSTNSKEQAQSLEIKSDGIYVNGKLLTSLIEDNQGNSDINVDDVKDIINSTTGIEDWDKFKDNVNKATQDAQQAAEGAAQAGLDAKLSGENASQKVSDLKDKMLYYLSLSPEKDMYVPGKYLILNEDVTIKNGFIKEGYIDDAAINSASIKDAAITSAKIKDLAVYSAKIANAAITNAKIADLSVGTAKIRDLAVTDEKVGKLTFNHMIGETLDANLINVTNLTADSIKAHSITADKITVSNLGELSSNIGNITGGSIDAGNVTIDNLPADDPNILTPDKKVKLKNTVDTLQEAVKAQNDFQNSVGAPSDTCNMLNMNMSKLITDTNPILRDMNSNSEYDHTLIDNDIDNVNIELNNLSHKAITTIGKTADGKNTIYTGAFAPSNPHIGDIWAKPSDDGSNEGTFEIYGQNGWFSPTKDVYEKVQSQINNIPKSYYQSETPLGDIVYGSTWYKPKYDSMGNVSFDEYIYKDDKWEPLLDDNYVQLDKDYKGVKINNDTGIEVISGNNKISLNGDYGIDIYGNGTHNLSIDNQGNLTMRGNIVAGNISGVNLTGNNLNLEGLLNVNGSIVGASGNIILNNDGLTINKGSINIGNGNGTTFSVHSDGTLFSNSANITGQLTAKKILIANDADDIVMNANGNFILNKDGSVYANNLSIKNGIIDGSTVRGSSIIGSSLKLSDTYNNLFYSEPLSRAQYDSYGLRTGSTTKGQRITNYSAINHVQGIREHRSYSLVDSLYKIGWYITSDGSFVSDNYNNNIASDKISILQGLPINISISDGPSNIFTRGGDRIICFYDSNNNFISGISTTTNQIKVTPPQNASYLSISIAVGGGAKQWFQAISSGNLTIDTNNSVILWQGDCSEGYSIVDYGYNEDLNSSNVNLINSNSSTQYFSLDASHLMDGDRILLELDINYDSYKSFLGSCFYLTINNKNEMDSESYFGSDNIQYAMQGNYKYTWVLEYHQSLGNTIVVNLNMKNQYYGTRWFITSSNEIISPINNLNDYSYYGDKINTLGVMSILNSDGDIRQSKISEQVDINSGSSLTKLRDIQQHQGYMMLQSQNSQYDIDNGALNVLYNDTSKVYLSGSGMAFIGDFNKNYVEQYMYPGHYTTSIDGKLDGGSAITFWGNISCDSLEEEGFSYALGTGLVIDNWGNFHLMFNSTSWNLNNNRGVLMLQLDQTNNNILMGNMYGANVPGFPSENYYNGRDHIFKFVGSSGHIILGRMWMSTFGYERQSNSDVDFHLRNDNGWFRFFSGVASSDGTFHTISSKEDKYDIALLDINKSINAIQNTDFARFHYRNQQDRAESYQKGVIIDNSNNYSIDNSFVDDNGKTLNIMNLVATLADVVKEQQKQISELNAKVAYLEINK